MEKPHFTGLFAIQLTNCYKYGIVQASKRANPPSRRTPKFEGGIIVKKLVGFVTVLVLSLMVALPVSAGASPELGTHVGLMTVEKTVVAPTAVLIGPGPMKASPSSPTEVKGGDVVRNKFYLLANREGSSLIRLTVDENLGSVQILAGDRYLFGWFQAIEGSMVFNFYLPPKTSTEITMIYRVPTDITGKIIFSTSIYDGGEVIDEKG